MLLLICNGAWAKLYRGSGPPDQLTLIYHQVNFGGPVTEFARSLGRLLAGGFRGGKFDDLALMGPGDFLALLDVHLDEECRGSVVSKHVLDSGKLSDQDLMAQLRMLLAERGDRIQD